MKKQHIRNEAHKRIFEIEERFGEQPLPKSILSYYLLLRAIYYADFGIIW